MHGGRCHACHTQPPPRRSGRSPLLQSDDCVGVLFPAFLGGIGKNQAIQFPIANAYAKTVAAELVLFKGCNQFDEHKFCGEEANIAKLLSAEASWQAAEAAMQTFGGFAFSEEYNIERKFRETRLYQIAPVSTNMILAYISHKILGMPRSY